MSVRGWEPRVENALSETHSLNGQWRFRLGSSSESTMEIPGAWHAQAGNQDCEGPARFWRSILIPEAWLARGQVRLECDALAVWSVIEINGKRVGVQNGMWSPASFDITRALRAGENRLQITLWRPGARFPPRENLAGFLPDLGRSFGGIWQSARLRWFPEGTINGLALQVGESSVRARGQVSAPRHSKSVRLSLMEGGARSSTEVGLSTGDFDLQLHCADAPRWAPMTPNLVTALVEVFDARGEVTGRASRRVGVRTIAARGPHLLINGDVAHLRGVLDWGWHPDRMAPTPPARRVREQFAIARAHGFNLIKLCLFVPDEATFDAADEAGMLLWLELPLWQPRMTPRLRAMAAGEVDRILARVYHHPSLAVLSLGCELDQSVDQEFLADLNAIADRWAPDVLRVTNSGSAEAYGGIPARADLRDYHFYAEPHFFTPLLAHFDAPGKPAQPWVFGEFCDADTMRSYPASGGQGWLTDPLPPDAVPELAWTRDHARRLATAGVKDGGAELTRIGRRQALAVRKFILEHTRARHASGGYVVSGWRDTPITTSGLVDDDLRPKFDPAVWRRFNADRVLLLERDRRRAWVAGGDRPLVADPLAVWSDAPAAFRLLLANGGPKVDDAAVSLSVDGRDIQAASVNAPGGETTEAAVFDLPAMPRLRKPRERAIEAKLRGDGITSANGWQVVVVPDRAGTLRALAAAEDRIVDALCAAVLRRARAGERIVVWLRDGSTPGQVAVPFWREAIHVFSPHPIWGRVPQPGYADLRFFSLATDRALDPDFWKSALTRRAEISPIWRRFDARRMTWSDYAIEARVGKGALVITTLRFAGGLGAQASGFENVPLGAWMMRSLL
jgi:hypothetical protein